MSKTESIEQIAAEEVNHWSHFDRKRNHRSFAVHTKMSPLLQADDFAIPSLNADDANFMATWMQAQGSAAAATPKLLPSVPENADAPPAEADEKSSSRDSQAVDPVVMPVETPSPHTLKRTFQAYNDIHNEFQSPRTIKATFQAYNDIHNEFSDVDPNLKLAMLGVAALHVFLILGTTMLLTCLAVYSSGGSAVSTLAAVIGIVVIVVATLKVNRLCLTAAMYLILVERRQ